MSLKLALGTADVELTMGPLHGIRIIEFAGIGPAPFCGMLLADLGAEVILVERRADNPNAPGLRAGIETRFGITNRGKKSIAVDLKKEGAAELLKTAHETGVSREARNSAKASSARRSSRPRPP